MDAAKHLPQLPLRRPRVLVVGSPDHPDFTSAITLLKNSADVSSDDRPRSPPLDLVLVCRVHPGAVAQQDVDQLQHRHPQTPIAVLLGSWCEGETRTGRPWPGIERVYWYQFPAWWRQFLLANELHLLRPESPSGAPHRHTVLIDCPYRETFDALADTLPEHLCGSVWLKRGARWPRTRGAVSGIWVGGQLSHAEVPALERFSREIKSRSGRLVAMLDFPRHDGVALAQRVGVDVVLGMPWRDAELCGALGFSLKDATTIVTPAPQRDAA